MTPKNYNDINDLIAQYSELNAKLEETEAAIKTVQLAAARELLPTHAELKVRSTALEARLLELTNTFHQELFPDPDKRNHKTPFGTLQFHRSACLEYEDEDKVLLKIKVACFKEAGNAALEKRTPRFTVENLIRTNEAPNLEYMDTLDDATVTLFGVVRERKDNFKVTPFDMKSDKPAKTKKVV